MLNKKLNLYFEKNPNLDKNMVIKSLESLIQGGKVDTNDVKILRETGFFDIVYNINYQEEKNNFETDDLFNMRSKISQLFDKLSKNDKISLYHFNKIFDKNYSNLSEKSILLDFDEYNDKITNKIFNTFENKISSKKAKFNTDEILDFLTNLINELDNNTFITNSCLSKDHYMKDKSSDQIENILDELQIDNNIINTIDINNKESIDIIKSVYDSEISVKESTQNDLELLEVKENIKKIQSEYINSAESINGLIDNSKKLEGHVISMMNKFNNLEELTNKKINELESNKTSNNENSVVFKNLETSLKNIAQDLKNLESDNSSKTSEIEIIKNRLSLLDTDYSKHKECVVNSFEIIEERLTQLFKSMIIVNNNVKHCFSNTEKMYSEIVNKLKN